MNKFNDVNEKNTLKITVDREELKKLIDEIPEENLYLAKNSLNSVIEIGSFSKALDLVINLNNKEE